MFSHVYWTRTPTNTCSQAKSALYHKLLILTSSSLVSVELMASETSKFNARQVHDKNSTQRWSISHQEHGKDNRFAIHVAKLDVNTIYHTSKSNHWTLLKYAYNMSMSMDSGNKLHCVPEKLCWDHLYLFTSCIQSFTASLWRHFAPYFLTN